MLPTFPWASFAVRTNFGAYDCQLALRVRRYIVRTATAAWERHVALNGLFGRYSVSMAGWSAPSPAPQVGPSSPTDERIDRYAICRHDRASSRATRAPSRRTDRHAGSGRLSLSRDRAEHAICAYRQRRDRGRQNGSRHSRPHIQPTFRGGTAAKSRRTASKWHNLMTAHPDLPQAVVLARSFTTDLK